MYPLSFGANRGSDGRTHFSLWAPDCRTVSLEIDGAASTAMQPQGDGCFTATVACAVQARYRYRVGPDLVVPDPASRAQATDVHDPSLVIDPRAYAWQNTAWRGRPWHETVLYEAHVGLLGGFTGLAQKLPELVDLGITAVELMPVADFPGSRNWGYDGVLPFAPDRAYGTPDDLKALIDRAHGLGLMMFLDVVYNHFGPDGNYLGAYASPFFRHDTTTPWGPAIDFRRPQVRQFFIENALYWLMEYRFDGLRLDAVHAIGDPGWLDALAAEVRRTVEPDRHVHLVLEHDGNAASHLTRGFDAQWNDDGHHVLHVLLTGERDGYYGDYADAPARHLARCLSEGFIYQGDPSPYRDGESRGEPSAHLSPTSFVLFLQNHDQVGNRAFGERLNQLCPPNALRAATALVLLSPQIPLLFMGEEWASASPFLYFTSHNDALAVAVRDGRRREFARFPAFASAESQSRIPDPNSPATFQASDILLKMPSDGSTRWRAFVRELLAVRRDAITPYLQGAQSIGAQAIGDTAVQASWRLGDKSILTIAANFGVDAVPCQVSDGRVLFATDEVVVRHMATGSLPARSLMATLSDAAP
ncbi:malto-oligosyltrehalose trehalohydrolase [Reyranella sp. CPCC 100927]|nr:malto-oligosyltrehalose trehalohydrolase [Reyranella sp. CPCC 100927]